MNNIFENAQFGDKFVTRDGTIAIYIARHEDVSIYYDKITIEHTYALPNLCTVHWCKDDGTNCSNRPKWDIVSRVEEEIDEKKLNMLAEESFYNEGWGINDNPLDTYIAGYKNGWKQNGSKTA